MLNLFVVFVLLYVIVISQNKTSVKGGEVIFLTEEARNTKREYERKWRADNPDKVRAKNHRYWEKKAAEKREGDELAEDKANL